MTKEEYIKANFSKWERFKMNLLYLPAAILLIAIIIGLATTYVKNQEVELTVGFALVWILITTPCVILNVRGGHKKQRLIDRYDYEIYMSRKI